VDITQQYSFALVFPQAGGGGMRLEAFWIDMKILDAFTPPEGFAVTQAAHRMTSTAEEMDEWLASH
jgi:hypothetical protein